MSNNILNDISKVYLEQVFREESHLDPVGQEDADIDNDGDTDESDKYLHNRRKVVGKAISKKKKKVKGRKVKGRRRKVVGKAISKKKVKEGYSNWRQDLAEVINVILSDNPIKEKKVKERKDIINTVVIHPKLCESVENLGGTLLEMIELNEKAESKQQQKLFGLALSVKRGQTPRSEVSDAVLKIVDTMSEKKIRDFAKTKHEGIPKKVDEQLDLGNISPPDPALEKNQEMLNKKKLQQFANRKVLQQKQQYLQKQQNLERQRLQLQKTGKLPLDVG
jgi:hypothetical protein